MRLKMFLVKVGNNIDKNITVRWIKIDKNIFMIKQLKSDDLSNLIDMKNILSLYKINRNNIEILKTESKLFENLIL